MILRDRDANTAWECQADQTPESRVYYCQNWRADVVALMTSAGALINQVRYDPYGVPFGIAKTDLEADGDVDNADASLFATYHGAGTMPFADWNWDGTKDLSDQSAYTADKSADSGLGRGVPAYATWSHAGAANRKLYAGYEIDPVLTGSEGWQSVYHVRHRVYLSQLGRWTRRDPLGYVDGMNLISYIGTPMMRTDALGLRPGFCMQGGCGDIILKPIDGGPISPQPITSDSMCCALANKGNEGATVCCFGRAIVCVYEDNINRGPWHPDVKEKMKQCTARHESIHTGDVDCSKCLLICTPTDGLPWTDGCNGSCSEAEAYRETADCMRELNCKGDKACEKDRDQIIDRAEQEAKTKQAECDKCHPQSIGGATVE